MAECALGRSLAYTCRHLVMPLLSMQKPRFLAEGDAEVELIDSSDNDRHMA